MPETSNHNYSRFLLPDSVHLTLPSGMEVTLRPPSLDLFLRYGQLPARLVAIARGEQDPQQNAAALSGDELVAWAHAVISEVFIEPRFSTQPGPGEFHPRQLQIKDRQFISEWANQWLVGGASQELANFREPEPERAASAGTGSALLG